MKQPPTPSTTRISISLYWKISGIFLLILAVLALVYLYITAFSANRYFEATHQRLNSKVAAHIAEFMPPFEDVQVDQSEAKRLFFEIMVMNPSVEVYLLSPQGEILSYDAPEVKIKRRKVSLPPILRFIDTQGSVFIVGDDPKSDQAQKIFSAAKVEQKDQLLGYVYVVLASEEYDSATAFLLGSHVLRLGSLAMVFTLIASLAIGLLAFWLITHNLSRIIKTAKEFREGNLQARIEVNSSDELSVLAHTFNDMADTLVRNLEELKTEEKLRRELIANVSHDLRTPITAVLGYAETIMMKREKLSEAERDQYITIIFQSTEKLRKLVDQLFELSKLEALESIPDKETFNIGELIQDIYHQYLILAQQKDIAMDCLNFEGSTLVRADIGMMERVLQNLIDNAIKYTSIGGTISISLTSKGNQLTIAVSNSGPGILPLHLPHIFERYHHKADSGAKSHPTGMGLGLVIVKRILDLHGFPIDVQTEPDGPTRFCFHVPLVR